MSTSYIIIEYFIYLSVFSACIFSVIAAEGVEYSDLWGKNGERWSATSRLPDFSYAGYHSGEAALPQVKETANVRSFGAKGDGQQDDTQAFLDAIEKTESGAIFVPPGRYKITKILHINKSNIVLRGAGPEKTTLFFSNTLTAAKPNWGQTTDGRRTSNYSWSGGFIRIEGDDQSQQLATVTVLAQRGDQSLMLSSTQGLQVGQDVELAIQEDAEQTLLKYLYSGDSGNIEKHHKARGRMVFTLTEVGKNTITFNRPLRFDVRLQWKPSIRQFSPSVREVGIEHLRIEFPKTPYAGHFTELGYNAIAINEVAHCWVDSVHIINADSGVFVRGDFCTLSRLVFSSQREAYSGCTGHHAILLSGTDNPCTGFDFQSTFIHDLGVTMNSMGNVYADGKGVDLNFDHHRRAPYENLFTNIDVGKGSRLWESGGGQSLGKFCGARGTFWNIRSQKQQQHPGQNFAPLSINLVAVQSRDPSVKEFTGEWFEAIDPLKIKPQNIHQAQYEARMFEVKKDK